MSNILTQNRIAYQIDMLSGARAIQIRTLTLPDGISSASYSEGLTANNPATWSITDGALPPGLTLNTNTGEIFGTPTTTGIYTFTITADDGETTASREFTLKVCAAITTSTLPDSVTTAVYSQQLSANSPSTWGITSGALPAGLTLSGAGVISGTPTTAGSYTFTVGATSNGVTTEKEYTIAIAARDDSVPVTSAVWSAVNLPEGLSLSSTGLLTGTPTTAGTYAATITVTTNWGRASRTVNIRVTSGS